MSTQCTNGPDRNERPTEPRKYSQAEILRMLEDDDSLDIFPVNHPESGNSETNDNQQEK